MERLDPWAPVGSFSDLELRAALGRAAELLAANTGGGRRVTTGRRSPGEAFWVYGRTGRPCRRCGTPIKARRQGTRPHDLLVLSLSAQPNRVAGGTLAVIGWSVRTRATHGPLAPLIDGTGQSVRHGLVRVR